MKKTDTKNLAHRAIQSVFFIVALGFIVTSCADNSSMTGLDAGKARMNISLTDAPANYQQVNIDVQAMRMHYTSEASDSTDGAGRWIDLPVEPFEINLLELTNGVDTLLSSAELEPGTYRELRLILGPDNSVVVDSVTTNLKVPSGQQSGYKIKFQTDLEAGEEIDVTVDFDAARSVHKAGNSGKYILRPVLKAFVENGEEVATGSIAGVVDPTEAAPNIYAIMDEDTAGSTQPNDEGGFLLEGLNAGPYNLSIVPTNDQYSDTTLTDVTVEKNQETNVGTVTLSEN